VTVTLKLRVHDQAVVDFLRAQTLIAGAQARIGDMRTPAVSSTPYAVVYPAGLTDLGGPVSDPSADGTPLTEVMCVGDDRNEAEGLADSVTAVMLAATIAIPGRALARTPGVELARPTRRDDTVQPPLYLAVVIFRLPTTPA